MRAFRHTPLAVLGAAAVVWASCSSGVSSAPRARAEADVLVPDDVADSGTVPIDAGRREADACAIDADCGGGATCFRCGNGSGTCLVTCEQAGCPAGSVCRPVQCIRCPCPPQCVPGR